MPLSGSAPVTANTLTVTQQAQQYFDDTVANLQTIANAVNESRTHLVSSAMISESGAAWGNAVNQWSEQFADIIQDLQSMSDMLGVTINVIVKNEGTNGDLVQQLAQQATAGIAGPS